MKMLSKEFEGKQWVMADSVSALIAERNMAMQMAEAYQNQRDALQARVAELEKDAARYRFIRSGEVYIEPNHYDDDGKQIKEFYAAFETGKYYHDMRDFDTDIDLAMNKGTP